MFLFAVVDFEKKNTAIIMLIWTLCWSENREISQTKKFNYRSLHALVALSDALPFPRIFSFESLRFRNKLPRLSGTRSMGQFPSANSLEHLRELSRTFFFSNDRSFSHAEQYKLMMSVEIRPKMCTIVFISHFIIQLSLLQRDRWKHGDQLKLNMAAVHRLGCLQWLWHWKKVV